MRNGIFPLFTKGRVLKKESIEYLRDFPYDLVSLEYENYSDGILFGFTINCVGGNLHISKGAIKHQGNIILVPETTITITEYAQLLYTKLVIGQLHETDDCRSCQIEIRADKHQISTDNEKELGRFSLDSGERVRLRREYISFDDLSNVTNTLNITHVSYAGLDEPTLHPQVLKEYAKFMLASSSEAADTSFSLMCLNASVVHKKTIQWYLAVKKKSVYVDYSLPVLYEKLLELIPRTGKPTIDTRNNDTFEVWG